MKLNSGLPSFLALSRFSSILIFVLLSHVARVSAASDLVMAEEFNILAVNGSEFSSGFFKQDRKIPLRQGLNQLAIEFEAVYDSEDGDNFSIVKSNPFLLKFYINTSANYQQRILRPKDADAALSYVKNPLFDIIQRQSKNSKVKVIPHTLEMLPNNNRDFAIMKTRHEKTTTLNLSHPNSTPGQKSPTIDNISQFGKDTQNLKMLKYWWQKASDKEKQEFLRAIEQ